MSAIAISPARVLAWGLLALVALGGCVTAYGRGESALRAGRYEDAVRHFQEAVGRDPDRAEALTGLGIAQYKLGRLPQATAALAEAVRHAPGSEAARLYLGLAHLKAGAPDAAREQFVALSSLEPHPRLAGQLRRASELIAGPLPDRLRDFIADALEHELEWEREVVEARRTARAALEPTWTTTWDDFRPFPPVPRSWHP